MRRGDRRSGEGMREKKNARGSVWYGNVRQSVRYSELNERQEGRKWSLYTNALGQKIDLNVFHWYGKH